MARHTMMAWEPDGKDGAVLTFWDDKGRPLQMSVDLEDLDRMAEVAADVRSCGPITPSSDDRMKITPRGMERLTGMMVARGES